MSVLTNNLLQLGGAPATSATLTGAITGTVGANDFNADLTSYPLKWGATPATAGKLRTSSNPGEFLAQRNAGNTANLTAIDMDATTLYLGTDSAYTASKQHAVRLYSGGNTYIGAVSSLYIHCFAGSPLEIATFRNFSFGGYGSYGSGDMVQFFTNRTTAPTSNPTGGTIGYAESGAYKFRGSGGAITGVAPAGSGTVGTQNAKGDWERYFVSTTTAAVTVIGSKTIPSGASTLAKAFIIGRNISTGATAYFEIIGACKNVAGTVSLVGTPVAVSIVGDIATTAVTITANDGVGVKTIEVNVADSAGASIDWQAEIIWSEN